MNAIARSEAGAGGARGDQHRHHRRHQRAPATQRGHRHLRDHRGVRGHPPHPAHEPQVPLLAEVDQTATAGRAAQLSRGGGAARFPRPDAHPTHRRGAGGSRRPHRGSASPTTPEGDAAIAVCLLFSYVNPAHELRAARVPAGALPRRAGLPLAPGRADLARVRAGQHRHRRRLREADHAALHRGGLRRLRRRRVSTPPGR